MQIRQHSVSINSLVTFSFCKMFFLVLQACMKKSYVLYNEINLIYFILKEQILSLYKDEKQTEAINIKLLISNTNVP